MEDSTIKKHTISDILKILDDNSQSGGLHVFLNKEIITEKPLYHPFMSDNFDIIIVVSGKLSLQLNLINYTLEANEFIIISPKMVTQFLDVH